MRAGRPVLTPHAIGQAALEIAGREGFPAVTMRRLAEHLGVTVRALYNHVGDRQEVVDLAAQSFVGEWRLPPLDPSDWRRSFRDYVRTQRELYGRHPRAILVGIDERVRIAGVHPSRLENPERVLRFLVDIGLSLPVAAALHGGLLLQLTGFALLVDHPAATGPSGGGPALAPAPAPWIDAHPELELPLLRRLSAADLPQSADEAFDALVDLWIVTIDALRRPPER